MSDKKLILSFDKKIGIKNYFLYCTKIILIKLVIFLVFVFVVPKIIKFNRINFWPITIAELLSMASLIKSIITMIITAIIWSKNPFEYNNGEFIQYIEHSGGEYNNYEHSVTKRIYKLINIANIKINRGYIILNGDFTYKDEINTESGFNNIYDEENINQIKIPRIYKNEDTLIKSLFAQNFDNTNQM